MGIRHVLKCEIERGCSIEMSIPSHPQKGMQLSANHDGTVVAAESRTDGILALGHTPRHDVVLR